MSEENKNEEVKQTVEIEKDEFVSKDGVEDAIIDEAFSNNDEVVPPVFFMEDDVKVSIELDIMSNKKTGKIVGVFKKDTIPVDVIGELFLKTCENFEFTVPTFEEVTFYRQQSSNNANRVVDKNIFRNFIIINHLKDWSLKGKDGNKIEIDFEKDGSLKSESIKAVNRVPVIIWDVVLTAFEKETLIS